jgi:hypothetical protein
MAVWAKGVPQGLKLVHRTTGDAEAKALAYLEAETTTKAKAKADSLWE